MNVFENQEINIVKGNKKKKENNSILQHNFPRIFNMHYFLMYFHNNSSIFSWNYCANKYWTQ